MPVASVNSCSAASRSSGTSEQGRGRSGGTPRCPVTRSPRRSRSLRLPRRSRRRSRGHRARERTHIELECPERRVVVGRNERSPTRRPPHPRRPSDRGNTSSVRARTARRPWSLRSMLPSSASSSSRKHVAASAALPRWRRTSPSRSCISAASDGIPSFRGQLHRIPGGVLRALERAAEELGPEPALLDVQQPAGLGHFALDPRDGGEQPWASPFRAIWIAASASGTRAAVYSAGCGRRASGARTRGRWERRRRSTATYVGGFRVDWYQSASLTSRRICRLLFVLHQRLPYVVGIERMQPDERGSGSWLEPHAC